MTTWPSMKACPAANCAARPSAGGASAIGYLPTLVVHADCPKRFWESLAAGAGEEEETL